MQCRASKREIAGGTSGHREVSALEMAPLGDVAVGKGRGGVAEVAMKLLSRICKVGAVSPQWFVIWAVCDVYALCRRYDNRAGHGAVTAVATAVLRQSLCFCPLSCPHFYFLDGKRRQCF